METQIEQTKEFHAKTASSLANGQCKAVYANNEAPLNIEPYEVPFNDGIQVAQEEDLGISVNVMPKSIFEHLKIANLKKTDMIVEMADMTKRAPIRILENVLVKIDKFIFLSDFVIMDMLNTRNEIMILGRPFLPTIHAKIDVFNKEISLGIRHDGVTFDMDKKVHNFTTTIGKVYTMNSIHSEEHSTNSNEPSDMSS
ncbi:putative reverse transcriptase domain-containing protein [Tanacetum coccineum]|uniref:Reverse transcriptase domain-containing protein n=1 Tax=Tanacetum coccineum TaxID=301880 RepID=A0ABQ4YSW9_9ASTR